MGVGITPSRRPAIESYLAPAGGRAGGPCRACRLACACCRLSLLAPLMQICRRMARITAVAGAGMACGSRSAGARCAPPRRCPLLADRNALPALLSLARMFYSVIRRRRHSGMLTFMLGTCLLLPCSGSAQTRPRPALGPRWPARHLAAAATLGKPPTPAARKGALARGQAGHRCLHHWQQHRVPLLPSCKCLLASSPC